MPHRDLPHSRHNGLGRGVINPQKGHILCVPKSCRRGFIAASSAVSKRVTEVSPLRRRPCRRKRTEFINPPSLFLPNFLDSAITTITVTPHHSVQDCSISGGLSRLLKLHDSNCRLDRNVESEPIRPAS